MNDSKSPEFYDFSSERNNLIAMIGYEYGMLCQATGEYDGSIDTFNKIKDAAYNYGFVIVNPDSEDWHIDTGKVRIFAEMKAKEIHDDVTKNIKPRRTVERV